MLDILSAFKDTLQRVEGKVASDMRGLAQKHAEDMRVLADKHAEDIRKLKWEMATVKKRLEDYEDMFGDIGKYMKAKEESESKWDLFGK